MKYRDSTILDFELISPWGNNFENMIFNFITQTVQPGHVLWNCAYVNTTEPQ